MREGESEGWKGWQHVWMACVQSFTYQQCTVVLASKRRETSTLLQSPCNREMGAVSSFSTHTTDILWLSETNRIEPVIILQPLLCY